MPSVADSQSQDAASLEESLSIMLQKEQRYYKRRDYLNGAEDEHITESDRSSIVEWCYKLCDHCQINRETVEIAMDMVDRFLYKTPRSITRHFLQDREKYQLLALSAMYIASKLNEPNPFDSELIASTSQGMYAKEEVEAIELVLLHGLRWRTSAPTSIQFANHILSLIRAQVNIDKQTWAYIQDEVKYHTECAVTHTYFTKTLSSNIALAAIFNTVCVHQIDGQVRQAILHALVVIMSSKDFASPSELVLTKSWLQGAVKHIELACVNQSWSQVDAFSFKKGVHEDAPRKLNLRVRKRGKPLTVATRSA